MTSIQNQGRQGCDRSWYFRRIIQKVHSPNHDGSEGFNVGGSFLYKVWSWGNSLEQESSKVEHPIQGNKHLDFGSPTLKFLPNSKKFSTISLQTCSYRF